MAKDSRKTPLSDEQVGESDKLKALFDAKKKTLKVTQDKIAAELGDGVTQGAVSHFMNRRTALNIRAASVFARLLDVQVDEFSPRLAKEIEALRGVPDPIAAPLPTADAPFDESKYDFVPQYDAVGALGGGHDNTHVELRGVLAFKKDWLRAKRLKKESLLVIYGEGDSMEPTISSGDVLLINTAESEPHSGYVYAIEAQPKGTIVKRLVRTALGMWFIQSDNPDKIAYRDQSLTAREFSEVRVIGRVVWRGGDL